MIDERTQTIEASLDALLVMWHTFASQEGVGWGYPSRAPASHQYRCSRQYDDTNGAIDGDVDRHIAQAVGHQVDKIADPHRTALHLNARNLKTGVSVWSSPRLPTDQIERAHVVAAARNMLARRLMAEGLL